MRVLAIDGGGIRGLIPALVLAELDDASPENLRELRAHAEELIAARSEDLDAVVAVL